MTPRPVPTIIDSDTELRRRLRIRDEGVAIFADGDLIHSSIVGRVYEAALPLTSTAADVRNGRLASSDSDSREPDNRGTGG